ncbi:MAG: bifunctional diguanylate cyclase/phosphodiesterase [Lachnospiraceae bacterium]|nr:bifunctional diguanylate cyclase/phosphodiesterase [Lachnospiraceae bacterium]
MGEKIKDRLGLEKNSPYVTNYLYDANIKSSIYMSAIVIGLELWMILRTLIKYVILSDKSRDFTWIVQHFYSYVILLTMGILMLIYAVKYLKSKGQISKKIGTGLIIAFSVICIAFGIYISSLDYAGGKQILTFLTMELYVTCLLVWKPYQSFLILAVTFLLFYNVTLTDPEVVFQDGDKINLFCFWISILMASISIYRQRYDEGIKEESLQQINAKLEKAAVYDALTGVHNMRYFYENVPEILILSGSRVHEKVFMFLDIENFKNYNDQFGFIKGNELLTRTGKLIEEVYEGSLVARHSNDHFLVLTDWEGAVEKADKVRNNFYTEKDEIYLGLKVGCYRPDDIYCDPRQAIDKARYACYAIKRKYDRNFNEYDKAMAESYFKLQYIVNNIDRAVERGYIKVYYQPVVWSDSRKLAGCEALARWVDPKYGFLSPGDFIPILEEHRQIHKLDKCIYETVCRDIRESIDRGEKPVPVSLNFSRLDFELMDTVEVMEELVSKYDIDRHYIHIEVTESAMTNDLNTLQNSMKGFRDKGYEIWLDDFGSGYSSLNVLKDYHFDVMKLDMVFLRSFKDNPNARKIIKRVIELADDLGINTLTEGVETEEMVEFLAEIGCGRLQGYYYGKPMPIHDFREKFLNEA